MNARAPRILLVNPWIHDFAAYDVWAKPLGLLLLAAVLRDHGMAVSFIDCLDRFHPKAPPQNPYARHGRGPYHKTRIASPSGFFDIPRNFSRYGIEPEWFRADLAAIPAPDLILVTSLMTYWYPGVQETIQALRAYFPGVPVILGGIYATLCTDHAAMHAGADRVVSGDGIRPIFSWIESFTGYRAGLRFDPEDLDAWPYPAFDLQRAIGYVPLLTSRGCPFSCAYCASRYLEPRRRVRRPERVTREIRFWYDTFGVTDFVFYDDALLVQPERHIVPILKGVIRSGMAVRFHTPNAVHIREINGPLAELMLRSGFETLRLGLETTAFESRTTLDRKVDEGQFLRAVACLLGAGFEKRRLGAYLLAGLPGQPVADVERSILTVKDSGITPVIAYYTPIPHTPLWPAAVAASRYDIAADPVFTNNAVFPCMSEGFSWETLSRLKNLARSD
ncbi:radical SAM protein [Desulfococcus sp.]|uniref:B12-binding domain-containing radical SAM protein n=1 Tax=Desulfococcus sp. TaxID=2025834 RepID=UPI003593DEAC